jgi:uncharacterized membrane protein YkvA (DUF1232 family)
MILASTHSMRNHFASVPPALDRYLSTNAPGDIASVAAYIDRGATLIDDAAVQALQTLRLPLHAKIEQLSESVHLRRRLELLATFFEEASRDGLMGTPAHRHTAFALLYFLKGHDRIPDTVPEVGLLDDALIVQIVLQRHATALRVHWLKRRRVWSSEL